MWDYFLFCFSFSMIINEVYEEKHLGNLPNLSAASLAISSYFLFSVLNIKSSYKLCNEKYKNIYFVLIFIDLIKLCL